VKPDEDLEVKPELEPPIKLAEMRFDDPTEGLLKPELDEVLDVKPKLEPDDPTEGLLMPELKLEDPLEGLMIPELEEDLDLKPELEPEISPEDPTILFPPELLLKEDWPEPLFLFRDPRENPDPELDDELLLEGPLEKLEPPIDPEAPPKLEPPKEPEAPPKLEPLKEPEAPPKLEPPKEPEAPTAAPPAEPAVNLGKLLVS